MKITWCGKRIKASKIQNSTLLGEVPAEDERKKTIPYHSREPGSKKPVKGKQGERKGAISGRDGGLSFCGT